LQDVAVRGIAFREWEAVLEANMSSNLAIPAAVSADLRRGRRLEYFTIAWNTLEAVASIIAGYVAGSTALIGFGLDSAIESSSGVALLWRLQENSEHESREKRTLQLVGVSFLVLAAYVGLEAVRTLISRSIPDPSIAGIAIAIASLITMPLLARAKRRTAARLRSEALRADSRQTTLCAYLSAILLGGLLLNAAVGWWWADPVAALVMVPIIAHEGVEALRGERCESCA
jgi:divalent metal cation (Fe/Co/Zn/Cd) transporter